MDEHFWTAMWLNSLKDTENLATCKIDTKNLILTCMDQPDLRFQHSV